MNEEKTKSFTVSKQMVYNSYLKVCDKNGGAGIDKETIDMFNENLSGNLYKVWNRMASGSYFPPAVRTVLIPKKQGGTRPLGIPTVGDRIAQGVVKDYLEPILEPLFHASSFGYRPGKSAHDALAQCNGYCIQQAWVVDLDIRGFFDNISHEWMMKMVQHHTQEKWVLLYIERWLKAGVEQADGSIAARTKGTPQGGVIALRTHSQTLSFSGGWKLKEVNFNYIIKSIIFMTNGKSTEYGVGQTHQPGVYYAAEEQTSAADSVAVDGKIWCLCKSGVPVYPTGKRDQRENGDTGKFCSVYGKTTTYTDQADKEVIGIQRAIDQQSGPYCAGRIFSKEGSCQKRRNNLRYHLLMIVCGSKSSRRFIIFLFRPANLFFSMNNLQMN